MLNAIRIINLNEKFLVICFLTSIEYFFLKLLLLQHTPGYAIYRFLDFYFIFRILPYQILLDGLVIQPASQILGNRNLLCNLLFRANQQLSEPKRPESEVLLNRKYDHDYAN